MELAEEVVRELVRAWNARDVERVAALHAPDYVGEDVGQAQPARGPEGVRRALCAYVTAFPDLTLEAEEVVVEGSRVAVQWLGRGTHRGRLMNIPPTGRRVAIRGVSILTIEAGQARRGLHVWDVAGLLRALGLLPEL